MTQRSKRNVGGAVLFLINNGFQAFVYKKEVDFSKGWNHSPFKCYPLRKKKVNFYVKEILCVQFNEMIGMARNKIWKKLNHPSAIKQCTAEGTLLLYIIPSHSE